MDQQYETPYIQSMEMVQQRAACWLKSDYQYNSSVTSVLEDLQWPSLQHWRYETRLKIFYNIVNSSSVLSIPNYFTNTTYPIRHHHPFYFEIPCARTDHYKFSYYPKSICDCMKNLPTDTTESQSLQLLNQVRAWFLKIDPVRIVGMCACVHVCVSTPEAINN